VGDYYPSAKLRLRIRIDEIDQPTSLTLPPTAITERSSREDVLAAITRLRYTRAEEGGPFLLVPIVTAEVRSTTAEGERSTDQLTHVVSGIQPKSVTVERNGIRAADTFKATFPYIDAPFEERLVRSCGVEVFMGVVSSGDFALGINGATFGDEPLTLVPDFDNNQVTNRRIIGFIDSWAIKRPADGQATVTIEGRDLTALLIDAALPTVFRADLTLPLDELFASILATLPAAQGLTIEMRPRGTEAPVLSRAAARVSRPRRGQNPRANPKGEPQKYSYWDYLTDLAGMAGFVTYVEDTSVVIQTPRTAYGSRYAQREADLYTARTVDGETFPVRAMIYGRNVLDLSSERKFAAKKANTVEVRCYDTQTKQTLSARFPPMTNQAGQRRVTDAPPGNSGGDEKIDVHTVTNCRDVATLRARAQSIYEQQARNEVNMTLETRDLNSFGGNDEGPDLLDLRAADSLEILVARQTNMDSVTRLRALDSASRVKNLMELGFTESFATTYASIYDASGIQTVFRVRDVSYDWTREEGVKIMIGLINYLVVRDEQSLPAGEEPVQPTPSFFRRQRRRDSADRPEPVRVEELQDDVLDGVFPELEGL
jgi:hypothetical protein